KNLFEVQPDNTNFTFDDLLNQAKKMYDVINEDELAFGLYACLDLRVLQGYGFDETQTRIVHFQVSENIVTLEPEQRWQQETSRFSLDPPKFPSLSRPPIAFTETIA